LQVVGGEIDRDTVRVVLPDLPSAVAVMVVLPSATPVTTPLEETVAMEGLADVHVTVRPLRTVPLLDLSVAVNCVVPPVLTLAGFGDTVTLATGSATTVIVAVPVPPARDAVICAVPEAFPVTTPVEVLIVATAWLVEVMVQTRSGYSSLIGQFVWSYARKMSCCVPFTGIVAVAGDTSMRAPTICISKPLLVAPIVPLIVTLLVAVLARISTPVVFFVSVTTLLGSAVHWISLVVQPFPALAKTWSR
jgi:hypothetical protein